MYCTFWNAEELLIDDPITNTAPHSLAAISSLSIFENQQVATLVGEFNATDPDANATLTYYLVNGVIIR